MLKKSAVENILAAALESGADFAEIYAERTKRSSIAMVNGKVETALGGMDYGAGVRLFFGNQAIYGFTNDLSEESLIRIAREGAAALRGMELKCDAIIKATKVDGVYDKDPMKHDDAVMFKHLSYEETLRRHLKVMDSTAITLAQENQVPIIVCNMFNGSIKKVVTGENPGTTVEGD
jgi:predicted Zn-dependent protease